LCLLQIGEALQELFKEGVVKREVCAQIAVQVVIAFKNTEAPLYLSVY
jgi:hypothetical protein